MLRKNAAGNKTLSKVTLGKTGCCLILALLPLGRATAQKSKDDFQASKLVVMEHLWNEAQVNGDARALDAMLGDSFIDTEYDGEVSDKAKFLADIRDPQFKPNVLTIHDVKVTLYENTAVIVGGYHIKGTYQGKPYDHLGRFTDTWVYAEGRWQCVASHSSLVKK